MKTRRLGQTTFERDANRLRVAARTPNQTAYSRLVVGIYTLTRCFSREGLADNTATALFTITTTNEAGNTDGGVYACYVKGVAGHTGLSDGSPQSARAFAAHFTRAQAADGTGVNSAVTEEYDDALADTGGGRTIDGIAMTVTETSEYVQTVNIAVDVSGASAATASIALEVTLVWYGFLTPPRLAAVDA